MGTISANKLGGLALMLAPLITLIFFFLQPGGIFVEAADPANASATITAMVGNSGLGKVASVLIPLGLLVFLYGIFVLQENIGKKGNGVPWAVGLQSGPLLQRGHVALRARAGIVWTHGPVRKVPYARGPGWWHYM